MNSPVVEPEPYFGTYLYIDRECSGSDIQYLTSDENGISFFDYLGDICDNTDNCYSTESFELMETAVDTILSISNDGNEISDGFVYIDSDSSITISYVGVNDSIGHIWQKMKNNTYSFTPLM